MKQSVIICVDDERIVLNSLKIELKRSLGREFIIETADSAKDALEVLKEFIDDGYEVPLVISDYIMPKMKGDELLKKIHNDYPNILKIMLTGQANTEAITNAVNTANLYRFISKPWDSTDLVMTISEAVKSYFQEKELLIINKKLKHRNEEIIEINKSLERKVQDRTQKLRKAGASLTKKNKLLTTERKKFETLLLNILPYQIAERLKEGETLISDHFDNVSIMFVDIADFTILSAGAAPERIVECLNEIFTLFDKISDKYGVEKIKTIGDCYMATTGLPEAREDFALAAARWALEIRNSTQNYTTQDGTSIRFRVGIDCGPVVAGVIGKKKFIYDLWGDAVNTASRMADFGVVDEVQITDRFRKALKSNLDKLKVPSQFKKIIFKERGEVEIKGKGMMKTYILKNDA